MKLTKPRRGAKRNIADFMLTCYAEATGGSKASITYDCIIRQLKDELARNPGMRKRYEEAKAKLLARAATPQLRVVK